MKSKTKALQIRTITEPGTTTQNKTGSWRVYKPEFNKELCSKCGICAQYCPDGIVYKSENGYYPNYDYCKGCGICANVCPKNAIKFTKEFKKRNITVEKLEKGLLTDKIKLAIVQLESPFYKQIVADEEKCIFSWKENSLNMLRYKVDSILNQIIETSQEKKPNIIVFPEYTIPISMIGDLKKFAEDNGIIIVAGSSLIDDVKSKLYQKNVCHILVPRKEYLIEKNELSRMEVDFVKPGERDELDLLWEYNDITYSIQITLSLDYMNLRIDERKGIIIVPMCSENVDFFVTKARQDIKKGTGKFIILCNGVTLTQQQRTPLIRGGTGIYGKLATSENEDINIEKREIYTLSRMGWEEGVLLAELNVENLSVLNISKFKKYKEDTQFMLETEIRGIVNPLLFEKLGRKLCFTFIKTPDYWEVRKILKTPDFAPFSIYAITGYVDLLIQHFVGDSLTEKLEENPIFEEMPHFTVNKVLRWLRQNNLEPPKVEPSDVELEDILKLERDWRANVPVEKRKEYLDKKYILGHWKNIDERKENKIHAFIIIEIQDIQNYRAPFETLLKKLINNYPYIVNAYECEGQKYKDIGMNYLIEIIDDPYWVFALVNDILREKIKCHTMTCIVKEKISMGLGPDFTQPSN